MSPYALITLKIPFIVSEIFPFTNTSGAQGTGRYTVAVYAETVIDGYQQNK